MFNTLVASGVVFEFFCEFSLVFIPSGVDSEWFCFMASSSVSILSSLLKMIPSSSAALLTSKNGPCLAGFLAGFLESDK